LSQVKRMMNNSPFSEVIQSSLQNFTAQCWQWNTMPDFGALVTIEQDNRVLFGIVFDVQTGSMDPARVVQAYQKTEQELRLQQPQIFAFLRTTFSCIIVGYRTQESIIYQLAPQPAMIHAFVRYASLSEQQQFFGSADYLYRLCNASYITDLDELLLILLKQHYAQGIPQEDMQKLFEVLSACWQHDYHRLKIFTRRVTHVLR